jgi:type I restriction enzyme S subunit
MRAGYKQTEVGVIPEDWDVAQICSLARLESGHTPSKRVPAYWGGDVPWVSLHDSSSLDVNIIEQTTFKITQLGLDNSSARLLPAGTVVFSRTATVGKSTILAEPMATSQDFAAYICGPQLHNAFLMFLFRGMRRTWQSLMAGSIHNTIYMPVFEALKIPKPSIDEQRVIATALADTDVAVAGLERLIAKKRDLKQAAMQQLLTGQTRLPGFSGAWAVKRLGDHVSFLRNGTLSRAQLTTGDPTRYLHYGDIHGSTSVFLSPNAISMPTVPSALVSRLERLEHGDLIFADASEDLDGVGKSVEVQLAEAGPEVVSGLHTIAARFDKEVLADGFKAYLQFMPLFASHLRKHAAGTKVLATNRGHVASVELPLPKPEEQRAISAVFRDMDAELAALKAQLDKTRLIKQAMMQDLLTGRVRLPFQ